MHGPIPMKVESCQAEMVRVCLSPAQILRQGSVQAIIVGLRTYGRRTHEDEWDEVRARQLFFFSRRVFSRFCFTFFGTQKKSGRHNSHLGQITIYVDHDLDNL